jgi:hypothetical protein
MRLFVKLMLGTLVLAIGGLLFVRDPQGRPVLDVTAMAHQGAELGRDAVGAVTGLFAGNGGNGAAAGSTGEREVQLYRWRGADGNWHYSDQPPTSGAAERVTVAPDRNVVPGTPVPAGRTGEARSTRSAPGSETPVSIPGLPSPQAVQRLMDDAADVQQQLDQRARSVREATRELD